MSTGRDQFLSKLKVNLENQDDKQDNYSRKLARQFITDKLIAEYAALNDPYVRKELDLESFSESYLATRGVRLGCFKTRNPVTLDFITKFNVKKEPWLPLIDFLSSFGYEKNQGLYVFVFDSHGDGVSDLVLTNIPPYDPAPDDWNLTVCCPEPFGDINIRYLKTFLRNTWRSK